MNTLGDRLQTMRKRAYLTQEQVAQAAGVTRAAVSLWESGQTSNLKHEHLVKTARLFDMTVDELINNDEEILWKAQQHQRLILAAKAIKGWMTSTEIARQLSKRGYSVSEQSITNWKARGLSFEALLRCSQIIGCDSKWLETGEGEMFVKVPIAPANVIGLIADMDEQQLALWVAIGKTIIGETP